MSTLFGAKHTSDQILSQPTLFWANIEWQILNVNTIWGKTYVRQNIESANPLPQPSPFADTYCSQLFDANTHLTRFQISFSRFEERKSKGPSESIFSLCAKERNSTS